MFCVHNKTCLFDQSLTADPEIQGQDPDVYRIGINSKNARRVVFNVCKLFPNIFKSFEDWNALTQGNFRFYNEAYWALHQIV